MTKIVNKDRLFYDRYEYCVDFYLKEVTSLRELDHAKIDTVLDIRDNFLKNYARNVNYGGSWRYPTRGSVTQEMRQACHEVCDFLTVTNAGVDYKLVIFSDYAYLYTNDHDMVAKMRSLSAIRLIQVKQARVNRARDTIVIKNSRHEFRSYIRQRRLTTEERERIVGFLSNQQDIRLSPALDRWVKSNHLSWFQDNFFVDHNGMSFLTMFGLVTPSPIRKTFRLLRE